MGGTTRDEETEEEMLTGDTETAMTFSMETARACVCLLLQYLIQSCARGGRRIVEDMLEACVD
jgi:hypothetical protein